MISGFCREIFTKLPLEFAEEINYYFKIRRKCWLMALDSTILEIKDLQVSINENEILKI
jgi:hypothetical protein